MKQPSNDVCIHLEGGRYLDVIWSCYGYWAAYVRGTCIGRFTTRRRAKKAAKAAV